MISSQKSFLKEDMDKIIISIIILEVSPGV